MFTVFADSRIVGEFHDWDRACDCADEYSEWADVYIEEDNAYYADAANGAD